VFAEEPRRPMKTSLTELLGKLPHVTPAEAPGAEGFAHGTMALHLVGPQAGEAAKPNLQDAVLIVAAGSGRLSLNGEDIAIEPGDAVFLRAGRPYGLSETADTFAAWLIAWGPAGGEAPAPDPSVFAAIDA
jgi:hypothetical protein